MHRISWHTQVVCAEVAALQCLSLFSTSLAESQPTISASGTSDMDMDLKDLLSGNSNSDDPPIPTLKNLLF
jgi:hypothetical protein